MNALSIVAAVGLALLVAILTQLPAKACCYRYLDKPPRKKGLHWREWHHGYIGVVALFPFLPTQIVALIPLADDLLQHLIQLRSRAKRFYRSPLKRLSEKTWYRWTQES